MSAITTSTKFLSDSDDAFGDGDVFGSRSRANATWILT